MKKFVGIPNVFKGVGGDAAATDLIFFAIIDRNSSGFLTCYQKAAELFKKLESVQDIFKAIFHFVASARLNEFNWLTRKLWLFISNSRLVFYFNEPLDSHSSV